MSFLFLVYFVDIHVLRGRCQSNSCFVKFHSFFIWSCIARVTQAPKFSQQLQAKELPHGRLRISNDIYRKVS